MLGRSGLVRGGALAGVLLAGSVAWRLGHVMPGPTWQVDAPPLADVDDPAALDHGRHLVEDVLGCTGCHAADLGGGAVRQGGAVVWAPNLTGPRMAGWTPEDWARAVARGVGRDGRGLLLMPVDRYAALSTRDLSAVVGWLRRLPEIARPPGPTRLDLPARVALAVGAWPRGPGGLAPELPVAELAPAPDALYGAYLARVAGCVDCHGPDLAATGRPAVDVGTTGAAFAEAVTGSGHGLTGLGDLERDALWAWAKQAVGR